MVLNPGTTGDSHNWNYSKPDQPGFSLTLTGTVITIQEVQAMNFGADGRPSTPKFWENSGQPVMNIRMVLCGPSGGFRTWTFTPASKAAREGKKKSVHLDLFALAGGRDMRDLIGKTITITTVAPPSGFNYGVGNPRPWTVALAAEGPYQLAEPIDPVFYINQVYADTAVSGGVMSPPQTTQQKLDAGVAPQPAAPVAPQPEAVPDDIPF